jgi:hypothetical protein
MSVEKLSSICRRAVELAAVTSVVADLAWAIGARPLS